MGTIPDGVKVRASHVLIKHAESRNPISRRTNESTAETSKAAAEEEMAKWVESLESDERPMYEKFAALAYHRSDCGSFAKGGDLGEFGHGEMQIQFVRVHLTHNRIAFSRQLFLMHQVFCFPCRRRQQRGAHRSGRCPSRSTRTRDCIFCSAPSDEQSRCPTWSIQTRMLASPLGDLPGTPSPTPMAACPMCRAVTLEYREPA